MPDLAVEMARHPWRAAALVDLRLRRGLAGLATVAATGTLVGTLGSFRGVDGEKASILAAFAAKFSFAMVPAACGLLVAVPALAVYLYLREQAGLFSIEMENASLELVDLLGLRRR